PERRGSLREARGLEDQWIVVLGQVPGPQVEGIDAQALGQGVRCERGAAWVRPYEPHGPRRCDDAIRLPLAPQRACVDGGRERSVSHGDEANARPSGRGGDDDGRAIAADRLDVAGQEHGRLAHVQVFGGADHDFGAAVAQTPAWQDPSLPFERRAADLVGRMTLEEKVSQMMDRAPAIDRLGTPEYNWWNEGLHGVARSGLATVFPQAIGFAATWDSSLVFRMATVVSDEFRAKHEDYVRRGQHQRYQGLTVWSPNINLFRDPRWGRGQETYGEDP